MKKIFFSAVLALFAVTAQAQLVGTNSNANSASESTSGATAQNGGNTLIMPSGHQKTEVKTAPGHVLGGFSGSFSSDYCMGTAQIGTSFMGGSIGGGAPVADEVCQFLRIFERTQQAASSAPPEERQILQQASYDILCLSKPEVKAVFQARGLCIDKALQAADGRKLMPAEADAARRANYTGTDPIVLYRYRNK